MSLEDQLTYINCLLYRVPDAFSNGRQSHGQSNFSSSIETQEQNVLGGPTPLWVSTYTRYLLYKVQDPFSACRQSISQNIVSFSLILREDQSLLHRPRNSGRQPSQEIQISVELSFSNTMKVKKVNLKG